MIWAGHPFAYYLEQPQWLLVMALGCLGPLAGAVFVHLRTESYGGLPGLRLTLKAPVSSTTWRLVFVLLALHYGLAWLLRLIVVVGATGKVFLFMLLALILFGSQELGWRLIVQPELEKTRGGWKSILATGLLWAVWFLPLLFIPGFAIRPDFFLQFSAYLIGAGCLSTLLYKQNNGIVPCILFSAVFFALTAVLPLKQTNMVALLALVDVVIYMIFQSKRAE